MNIVKMNIHNSREGILTLNKENFTCITDQQIKKDDIILHPLYSKVNGGGDVFTFVVKEIIEERPSRGDWKDKTPSTWRSVRFAKETIPGKKLEEIGLLKSEEVKKDKGVWEKKTFLVW
jgi:hypothetical protein